MWLFNAMRILDTNSVHSRQRLTGQRELIFVEINCVELLLVELLILAIKSNVQFTVEGETWLFNGVRHKAKIACLISLLNKAYAIGLSAEFVTSKICRKDHTTQEIEENPKMSQTLVYTSTE